MHGYHLSGRTHMGETKTDLRARIEKADALLLECMVALKGYSFGSTVSQKIQKYFEDKDNK